MRELKVNTAVSLYVNIDEVPVVVGTTRLGNTGTDNPKNFQHTLHKHRPRNAFSDDVVVIPLLITLTKKSGAYLYEFKTSDEVPKSLRDIFTTKYHAWVPQ